MTKRLAGLYVALTTPFVGDIVSPERMRDNVARLNATGVDGYLVLGSTGECVSLTDDESLSLVDAVLAAASPGKKVIVGTARESTRLTIDFTARVAQAGVAAALVRPPSYYKSRMTREALRSHYLALADASKLPILIYNIPQSTGFGIDPRLVVELAEHPHVIGLKESSGSLSYLGEVLPHVPPGFHYLLGSGGVLLPGLEMGADGAILAVANVVPGLCVEILSLFKAGRRDEARRRQLDLVPINKLVTETYGIAGLKYAQDLLGFYGGPTRLPLVAPDERAKRDIEGALDRLGLRTSKS